MSASQGPPPSADGDGRPHGPAPDAWKRSRGGQEGLLTVASESTTDGDTELSAGRCQVRLQGTLPEALELAALA